MKRRDFVYGSAAVVGAAITQSDALAQTGPVLSATRTFQLFDSSSNAGSPIVRDVIFDGHNFLSLITSGASPSAQKTSPNVIVVATGAPDAQFSVTATTPSGERLWSYALPQGRYWGLGTQEGMVVIFATRYLGSSPGPAGSAVLLLDPQTGNLNNLGPANGNADLRYAGDSTFFKAIGGQGEIWTLGSALTKKAGGITVQALTGNAPAIEYLQSGSIAILSRDGTSMAVVASPAGYAVEQPIASDLVAQSRNFFASLSSQRGIDSTNVAIVTAIGGDQAGNILAIVSTPQPRKQGVSLIQMDSSASASYVGSVQLPLNPAGIPVYPLKLVGVGSEIGVVSWSGTVAWYPHASA